MPEKQRSFDRKIMRRRAKGMGFRQIGEELGCSATFAYGRYLHIRAKNSEAPFVALTEAEIADLYAGRRYDDEVRIKDAGRFTGAAREIRTNGYGVYDMGESA